MDIGSLCILRKNEMYGCGRAKMNFCIKYYIGGKKHILLKKFKMTTQKKLKYNYWCTIKCTGSGMQGQVPVLANAFKQEILTIPITQMRNKI